MVRGEKTVDQLVDELRSLGVTSFDRERLDELSRVHGSAFRCGEALAESIEPAPSGRRIEAIITIVDRLWDAWCPDRPRLDPIIEAMQVEDEERPELPEEAPPLADASCSAWRDLRNWMRAYDVESFARVDEFHDALISTPLWVEEFLRLLCFVSLHDERYDEIHREVVAELLRDSRLCDGDRETISALRVSIVWSVRMLDGIATAEQLLEAWLDADPAWADGWRTLAEFCGDEMRGGNADTLLEVVEILHRGLRHLQGRHQIGVLRDMADAEELLGDLESAWEHRRLAVLEERVAAWHDELAEQEPVHDIEEIVRQLRTHPIERPPLSAMASAVRHRAAVIPHLLELVRIAAETCRRGERPADDGYVSALYLLAQFRAGEAFGVVCGLLKSQAGVGSEMMDDILADDFCEILAAVAPDHLDELDALMLEAGITESSRWIVSSTYGSLVRDGVLARSDAVQRLARLLNIAVERDDPTTATICIVALTELQPAEVRDVIETAIEAGRLDESVISEDQVREAIEQGEPRFEKMLQRKRDERLDDALEAVLYAGAHIASLEWLARERSKVEDGEEEEEIDDAFDADLDLDGADLDPFAAERPTTIRLEQPRVGRNEPCPCGSGKKYKKCCARRSE